MEMNTRHLKSESPTKAQDRIAKTCGHLLSFINKKVLLILVGLASGTLSPIAAQSQPTKSQTISSQARKTVSISFQNEKMPDALKRLGKALSCRVIFAYEDVESYRVTASIDNATAEEAVKTVLKDTNLEYEFSDKGRIVTIRRKRESVSATTMSLATRTLVQYTGVVTDASGSPLPGVNVRLDGRPIAVSGEDGKFSFTTGGEPGELEFTFIGFAPYKRTIKGKMGQMKIRLSEQSIQSLDPSFVVNMNDINGSNPNNLKEITLRGKASFSGLQGDYDGNPNAPLFILDGFESTQEQIFDLDINRIKSVTILKDGAAKAIYGSKASNGVIVVETILPEAGRLRITYTGDLNVEAPDLSSYNLTNAAEKLQVEKNAGRYTSSAPYYQAQLDEQYNEIAKSIARGVDTDWLSQPLRTGIGNKHTMYLEGGTDEMRYSASLMYNDVAGVMKKSDRRTISGNINLSYRYNQWMFRNSLSIAATRPTTAPMAHSPTTCMSTLTTRHVMPTAMCRRYLARTLPLVPTAAPPHTTIHSTMPL